MEELAQGHTAKWNAVRIWTQTRVTFNLTYGIIKLQNYVHASSAISDLGQVIKILISVHHFL